VTMVKGWKPTAKARDRARASSRPCRRAHVERESGRGYSGAAKGKERTTTRQTEPAAGTIGRESIKQAPLLKFVWVMPVVGRENEWVNGGRDVRRSEPLTRSLSQISSRAWGWRSLAAPAPEPVRRRGLPRLGAGLGVGYRHPRAVQCSKNVQILTHSIFKRAKQAI
jgi:hypothetical protein